MSIKVILAPITGAKADQQILNTALTMATFTNAHIKVVFLCRDPGDVIASQVGYGMSASIIEPLIQAAEDQLKEARQAARLTYDKWQKAGAVADAGAPRLAGRVTAEYAEEIGNMGVNLANQGRLADMICVLRPNQKASPDWPVLVEAALIDTGKPVLLAPAKRQMQAIKSVAIAWNGSQEAARAVTFAMPVLEAAERVTVIAGINDDLSPADVRVFTDSLAWHGIKTTTKTFKTDGSNLGKRLQDASRKADAQLLVLGAYSHNRFRQFIFGGVTDDILKAGEMPILMAH
ncbi:MAG: universal stress protein [Rhodospirillales bacterium]|nr:universal stress protein [Rhodospirillales bacterium]